MKFILRIDFNLTELDTALVDEFETKIRETLEGRFSSYSFGKYAVTSGEDSVYVEVELKMIELPDGLCESIKDDLESDIGEGLVREVKVERRYE